MYHADGGSVKNVKGAGLSLCSELLSNSRNTITGGCDYCLYVIMHILYLLSTTAC